MSKTPRTRQAPTLKQGTAADAILEAALEEFATLGFEGARMTSIAERAGVTHPLIHHHFGSKNDLWEASVTHAFTPLVKSYKESELDLHNAKPNQIVREIARNFIQFSARHPQVGMIITREAMIGGPRLVWLAKTVIAPLHQALGRALKSAVKSGTIKPLPQSSVVQMLAGAVVHFYSVKPLMQELYGLDPLAPKRVEEHTEAVMEIFFRGLEQS